MVSHRTIGIRALTLFWQLVTVTLAFWLWFCLWEDSVADEHASLPRYLLYNEFLLIGIVFGSSGKTGVGSSKHEWVQACRKSGRQAFFGFFSVFLVVFVLKDSWISRSFFFSYLPWLYASLLFTNVWLSRSLAIWALAGHPERVALAGTLEQAIQFKPWLDHKRAMGVRTVGLIGPEPGSDPTPIPVLGTLDQTGEILRGQAITHLIVLSLSVGGERLRGLTQVCENAAVRLLVLHDLNTYFNHNTTIFDDDGVRFIGLREEPLESPLNRLLKRVLDLAVAVPVVCLILPFTSLVVWLLQRIYSPGPLFFAQQRNGMLGRPFRIYKYRTMHVVNDDESRQATKNDSRIFPAGAWLRKLSIDELPQFINVLLGDMSIVGPRPHMPAHDEMFTKIMRSYMIRRFIRPGITGWAQVRGFRGEIHTEKDVQDRVSADIYYLENWSFSLDCLIILKTIRACIVPPRSAY
jgi:putative colanic acid biosynthesis UDP-glucose lipid carrier transferase